MPRSVLHTYSKKRAPNDCSNMAFDKLIQDVSNNTIKKPKLSIPIINENSDENVYNMFDEPNLIKINHKQPKATAKNTKNDVKNTKSFFKLKKVDIKIMEEQKQRQVENTSRKKSTRSTRKSQVNLKNEETEESEHDEFIAKSASSSSSIVKSNSHSSTNESIGETTGGEYDSFLDLGQLAVVKTVKLEESKPKQQFFISKSKSLNDNTIKSNQVQKAKKIDSDSDEEFEKKINAKFRLTKSQSDTSSLITSSPGSSLNSSSFNEKESPKIFPPKRIFSSNQAKKVNKKTLD